MQSNMLVHLPNCDMALWQELMNVGVPSAARKEESRMVSAVMHVQTEGTLPVMLRHAAG